MTDAPEWTYKHATELRNHWWWRPGWQVGTRFYTWHITFDDQPELHNLVTTYQAELAHHPGLDLVPHQWLHLTMQGVGHAADFTVEQLQTLAESAQTRLAAIPTPTVQFHRLVVRPEAIVLPALPPPAVDRVRTAIREAIADALGAEAVPERPDGFQPHISVTYSSDTQPAEKITHAIEFITSDPIEVPIKTASLIELHRDRRMYEWRTIADLAIGQSA
jgi:2'-5' RNA ligase